MIRKIIVIDQNKCTGCGLCAKACHEGAIGIVDNKAVLLREDFCDGLGDCLPACPENAISFEERNVMPYNGAAVQAAKPASKSSLQNFPIQLKLLPTQAMCFDQADLLICADCCAYCYKDFHEKFINGKTTIIACPKLDATDYSQKLSEIFNNNEIKSITVVRMRVPCCGGLPFAVNKALADCNKNIPIETIIISPDGKII